MLFKQSVLSSIQAGKVTLAFRRWKRPTVKAGGTLITKIGQLGIESVSIVDPATISKRDAQRAGFESVDTLRKELDQWNEGDVYRIQFHVAGPDPRIALRQSSKLNAQDVEELSRRLDRLDQHATSGPWTRTFLQLIGELPAVSARTLCEEVGYERLDFKANVRKLKKLGLTESLNPGYRLSPRGQALLRKLRPT